MRTTVAILVALASLSACGGGGSAQDSSSEKDRRLSADDTTVTVYKSTGGVQCGGSGLSLTAMQEQLATANVKVRSAACGGDGMMYPAVCGAPDGRIGIFDIPATHASAAAGAGFALLNANPVERIVPCT